MKRALTILPLLLASCSLPSPSGSDSETRPIGQTSLGPAALEAARKGPVSFPDHVRPILEAKCAMCHNRSALPGRMSLENRYWAEKTGTLSVFVVPGKPTQSPLVMNVHSAHASIQAMPPVGEQVTSDEIKVLKKWIREGADWPEGAAGDVQTSP